MASTQALLVHPLARGALKPDAALVQDEWQCDIDGNVWLKKSPRRPAAAEPPP